MTEVEQRIVAAEREFHPESHVRRKMLALWSLQLNITLLFLPSYSPNLSLIERLWKFIKRRAVYGRYHSKFADF